MFKWLDLLLLFVNLIIKQVHRTEDEKISRDSSSEWSDGFGVRVEKPVSPKTSTPSNVDRQ